MTIDCDCVTYAGKLDGSEYDANQFKVLDKNGDGGVSPDEVIAPSCLHIRLCCKSDMGLSIVSLYWILFSVFNLILDVQCWIVLDPPLDCTESTVGRTDLR